MGNGSRDSLAGLGTSTFVQRCMLALGLTLGVIAIGLASGASSASAATDWICKPGQVDTTCQGPIGVDDVDATGQTTQINYKRPENPPIDCFYVYPTVSEQDGDIANHDLDKEVKRTIILQARQYSRVCDLYVPAYNQVTSNGLSRHGGESDADYSTRVRGLMATAYADLLTTWKDYLAHYNKGRGVILIGHSQGAFHLGHLIADQIDPKPSVRKRLISAVIPGANIWVPKGKTVGGQFKHVPECKSKTQLGCVMAWSVYRAEPDPGDGFGKIGGIPLDLPPLPDPETDEVICTNPGQLSGDNGVLEPLADIGAYADPFATEDAHPWWRWPDMYTGECKSAGNANWLNVSIDPSDTRTPPHQVVYSPSETNLHLVDMTLPMGNLIRIAQAESKTYVAGVNARKAAARKSLVKLQKRLKHLKKSLRAAHRKCRQKGTAGSSIACGKIKGVKKKISSVNAQIAHMHYIAKHG